ncbi:MAG: rhomboid family intramembrane serine protease, partial [Planctomycetaceae bacterium]|nr:rhomboid family intramembrane serine protease [Planctomycetaceae bacterium]
MTWAVVLVVVSLHLWVQFNVYSQEDRSAYREAGVLEVQQSADQPELHGPFDLWSGQWWRIPLGGLHHLNWFHLAVVVSVAIYLGKHLEPQIHWLTFLLFFVGALVVTTLPRWQAGDSVPDWFNGAKPITGLSGVLFAEFGVLLFLRQKDRKLLRNYHEGSVLFGIVMGLACLAFSTIGAISGVDNLAHIVGFFYGLIWGIVLFPSSRWIKGLMVVILVGAHGLLWPVFQQVIRPVDNGRYHWWLAENSDDPEF